MADPKFVPRAAADGPAYELEDNEVEVCFEDVDDYTEPAQKYRRKTQCHFCAGYYYALNQHLKSCKGML